MSDTPNNARSQAGKGNRNALRHGLKAGALPAGCKHVEHQCNALRRQLEDAVIAIRGEISLVDAANIQTAIKWERHGALALRWLRVKGSGLKPMETLQFSREIAKASTERDKALAALRLDRDSAKDLLMDKLYQKPRLLTGTDANSID